MSAAAAERGSRARGMSMRPLRVVAALFLLLFLFGCGDGGLAQQAEALGLRDVEGFVETVQSLCTRGVLPARYITKAQARRLGWRPGRDLCTVAPGRVIGGDRFGNREGRLPEAPGRVWYEADLDFACGRRGPRRLLFSSDGLIYVTVDHYRSFVRVACPKP